MVTNNLSDIVTIALNAHFIPILVWRGIGEATGAYLVGLFAFASIFTALGMGWVGDRWNKSLVCSAAMVPTILALVGLLFSQATPVIYFFLSGSR